MSIVNTWKPRWKSCILTSGWWILWGRIWLKRLQRGLIYLESCFCFVLFYLITQKQMKTISFKCFHLLKLGHDIWISIIELYFCLSVWNLKINRRLALEIFFVRTLYLHYKISFIYIIKGFVSIFCNSCLWSIILEWKVYF